MDKKLNWLLASKRLYIGLAALWAAMCTMVVLFDGPSGLLLRHPEVFLAYLGIAFVAPVVLYYLGRWVYQGLVTPKSGE